MPTFGHWQLIGLCRGEDPNVFFHPEGERGPARVNRDVKAKTVCGALPGQVAVRPARPRRQRALRGVVAVLTEDER